MNERNYRKIAVKNRKADSQADPYIMEYDGNFYIYATNDQGVTVLKGSNLFEFEDLGLCLKVEGQKEFWAPCVIEANGKFYLYYSSLEVGCEDVHCQRIKVAVSDRPDGGFEYVSDVLPPFSIDPHVVQNECGEYFIFYSVNDYSAVRAGTYIVVDKMTDLFTVEGKPAVVVRPTLDEEIFMRDRFKQGQHWHTLEGAFYLREGDTHYVMYSGNCYQNEYYYVGYATANGNESDLRKLTFCKYPNAQTYCPLLSKNDCIEGTGHNSAIKRDGKWYTVFHARDAHAKPTGGDLRCAYVAPLDVADGIIKITEF